MVLQTILSLVSEHVRGFHLKKVLEALTNKYTMRSKIYKETVKQVYGLVLSHEKYLKIFIEETMLPIEEVDDNERYE